MTKNEMIEKLNKMYDKLNCGKNKEDLIRSHIIFQLKQYVKCYDTLDKETKAFVDGFFLEI